MPNQNRRRARDLRRRQTEQELFVWRRLRNRRFADFKFRRQFPLGDYIVDFVCLERRLILELDGGQHGESAQENYDAARDAWLRSQGFKILRFWNHQVMSEWQMVEDTLWNELECPPHPQPLSRGGERGEVIETRSGRLLHRASRLGGSSRLRVRGRPRGGVSRLRHRR